MKRMGFVVIALAAAVTVGCNRDRDTRANNAPAVGTAGTADSRVTAGDRDFVRDVAIANMAEIELGRLAIERASHAELKKFGQMMIDDHTKAGEALKSVAAQHNVPLPGELDDDHRDLREKLMQRQGGEFDRDYVDAMVDGHEELLDKLRSRVDKEKLSEWTTSMKDRALRKEGEARAEAHAILPEKSDNPVTMAINQWAADNYPVVYAHLEQAKTLKDMLKNRTTD